MSCNFPKIAFQEEPGAKLLFAPTFDKEDIMLSLPELTQKYNWYQRNQSRILGSKRLLIPCGQCVECRLQKSREMATRIILEAAEYPDSWSVTLTYDVKYIKFSKKTGRATLVPDDLKKFMKDLRRYFEYHYNYKGIRFYACGEYGSLTARPHYHLILFNFPIKPEDIALCKNEVSQTGEDLFESPLISDIWNKGRVRLNSLTWQYAAYCARYMMKKQLGKNSEVYTTLDIVPEFSRMSNRPGLGYEYYSKNKEKILEDESVLVKIKDKTVRVPIPKYFIRKMEESGLDLEEYKAHRNQLANNTMNRKINSYSADIFEVLRDLNEVSKSKSKSLPRM